MDEARESTAFTKDATNSVSYPYALLCAPHKVLEFILRATCKCGSVYREGGGWEQAHLKGISKNHFCFTKEENEDERGVSDLPKVQQLMKGQLGHWNQNRLILLIFNRSSFCIILQRCRVPGCILRWDVMLSCGVGKERGRRPRKETKQIRIE